MSLLYDKISDSTLDTDVPNLAPAYWSLPFISSPSGNYAVGCDDVVNSDVAWLVDTHSRPPVRKWKHRYADEIDAIGLTGTFLPRAVDDQGGVWGEDGNNDGNVLLVPVNTELPEIAFTWTNLNGKSHGLSILYMFTLTTTGGATKVVIVPGGTTGHDNTLCFLGTKGTSGLTEFDQTSWVVWQAFLDDNDDVWVAGASAVPLGTTLNLKRLTNITGSSPYTALQTFTMPATGRRPYGYFSGGAYVGGWVNGDDDKCHYYFSAGLDGTFSTRDVSAAPVYAGLTIPIADASQPSVSVSPGIPSNPTHFFLWDASDPNGRTFKELLPDLTDGLTYNLDDWNANDGPINDGDSLVQAGIYLDGELAFAGTRHYQDEGDGNFADFFLYYFGDTGGGGGGQNDNLTIRCWGFKLDDHRFALFRLGPSETLVVDLATKQWAEWQSPSRDNFRAHIGCNWVGMTETLADGGSDVVAGDDTTGVLWRLDPAYGRDDNTDTGSQAFPRKVIGQIPLDGRETLSCGALEVSIALGAPSQTGAPITLKTSDDLGQSWTNHGARIIAAGVYNAVVEWRGLGTARAPGRLFSIEDDGATVRIGRADLR